MFDVTPNYMTPTPHPRLTVAEFNRLVAKARDRSTAGRRFSEEGIALARAVLVDGKGYTVAVRERGLENRNVAYQVVQRLLRYHENEGIESHTYTGPAEMFEHLDKIAAKYNGSRR
jgi:hypothetical protein